MEHAVFYFQKQYNHKISFNKNLILKAETMSQDQLLSLFSMSLIFLLWMIFPTDVGAVFLQRISDDLLKFLFELPYSRNIESEAVSQAF